MVRVDDDKLRLLGEKIAGLRMDPLTQSYMDVAKTALAIPSDSRVIRDNLAMEVLLSMDHLAIANEGMPLLQPNTTSKYASYAYTMADAIIKKSNEK